MPSDELHHSSLKTVEIQLDQPALSLQNQFLLKYFWEHVGLQQICFEAVEVGCSQLAAQAVKVVMVHVHCLCC